VIGLPLGEARPDGRARDMLVASRITPLRLIQCCRPLEQTAMARMMTPVRRTSERTMIELSPNLGDRRDQAAAV
jgi:hypothetical protein